MKVKILRNTNASGQSVEKGKEYDISDDDARILIRMGKAEPAKELPAKTKSRAKKDASR